MASKQIPNDISTIPKFKVVVVGDGGVGKSALTIQYFQHMFIEDHNPTIEDSYIQNVEIDGEWCVLDVLDTAGQDEFSAMREQYMRKGHGFIVVYSVTDPQSFRQVRRFHTQILRARDRDSYPVILAANKIDLVHLRVVSPEEGQALADELGVQYIETSAKNPPINVDLTFHNMVRIIRKHQSNAPPVSRKQRPKKMKCNVL
uniref:Ras-related protein M-Ras n=1 Tax=Schistocephalus solidus TaxID=70667 RepID=A0A0X3QGD8_SCHSO